MYSYVPWVCSEVQLFLLVGEWSAIEFELRLISIKPGVMTRVTSLLQHDSWDGGGV